MSVSFEGTPFDRMSPKVVSMPSQSLPPRHRELLAPIHGPLGKEHYRPDIDGLRAVAVSAVIAFHAFPHVLRGGFVGVDVFFVISGYLISGILFNSLDRREFSFLQFYGRRIRRIFPALILVLVMCLLAGWFLLFSSEYQSLGKHVAGSGAFIANFVLWHESGYFDTAAELKPLLHIWSLGIEEQFYIVWPLLLYLTWKRKALRFGLLLTLLVLSFGFNMHLANDAAADFYSPVTRFWELMAGALLAHFTLYKPSASQASPSQRSISRTIGALAASAAASNIKAGAGLICIVVAVATFDSRSAYPSWRALVPVVGAYLIIAAGSQAWINRTVLASRIPVAIGLISYPLYLWHWPLLSFPRIVEGQAPTPQMAALAIALSVLLAWATYLLIEKPIRSGRSGSVKAVTLVGLMVIAGTVGYFTYASHGFLFRNPEVESLIQAESDLDPFDARVINGVSETREPYLGITPAMEIGSAGGSETLMVGDSLMGQYIPRLREFAEQHAANFRNRRIVFLGLGGCPPIPGIARSTNPGCAVFLDKMIAAVNRSSVETVAFAGMWSDELTDGFTYLRSDSLKTPLQNSDVDTTQAIANFGGLISQLTHQGKHVFVLLENPLAAALAPSTRLPTGWRRMWSKPKDIADPTRANVQRHRQDIGGRIRDVAAKAGARLIDPDDYLCNKDTCPAFIDGQFIYFDTHHLRASFVRDHATYIDQILQKQ